MEYIIIFLLLIICVISYILWKTLTRLQFYEETFESLIVELNIMADSIESVLSKEIYSNDPVITSFVDSLKDLESYIKLITPTFEFNQLGEKTDG